MTREHTFTAWVYRGRNETEHEVEVVYAIKDGCIDVIATSRSVTAEEENQIYDTACERAESDLAEWREGRDEYLADCRRDARE